MAGRLCSLHYPPIPLLVRPSSRTASSLSADPPSGTAVLSNLWLPWIRPGCLCCVWCGVWCVVVAALELTRMPVLCMDPCLLMHSCCIVYDPCLMMHSCWVLSRRDDSMSMAVDHFRARMILLCLLYPQINIFSHMSWRLPLLLKLPILILG